VFVNEAQKHQYLEKYKNAKERGVKFYPDIIFKDLLVSFAIFVLLVGLAIYLGVAPEPRADPSDSAYIPRPEWYFLFLFQLLKYFPGKMEWMGTTVIPALAVLALLLLPFYDRSPFRYWKERKLAVSVMAVIVTGMIALTISAAVTTPPQESTAVASTLSEQIVSGQDLYSVNCVECHGAEGEGGEIKGVEGLEGKVVKSINTKDEMYTRDDQTLYNIIEYGQPDSGMTPFGKAYGGELSPGDIRSIVAFMRYTWDDRSELPAEVVQANAIPALGPDEAPSYEVHIAPIIKRYCISCHRPGKKNNNYMMGTYEEIMTSGDHAPNVLTGDLNSNLIRMLHRQEIEAGGPMPPTRELKSDLIAIFERWVAAGAPNTVQNAANASEAVIPTVTPAP
jgi:menaquinol-cytochrome c reductase cytochrome b/c subunit